MSWKLKKGGLNTEKTDSGCHTLVVQQLQFCMLFHFYMFDKSATWAVCSAQSSLFCIRRPSACSLSLFEYEITPSYIIHHTPFALSCTSTLISQNKPSLFPVVFLSDLLLCLPSQVSNNHGSAKTTTVKEPTGASVDRNKLSPSLSTITRRGEKGVWERRGS